jgi:hypothetical protein
LNIVDLPIMTSVPRDGWDRPLVIPKAGGKPVGHTRTTTFIDCIEDKSALTNWGKRSVLVGLREMPSLLDAAAGLNPKDKDDKRKLDALAEKAMNASGANDKREQGTYLHGLSELVDAGIPLPESASAADLTDMAAYKMSTLDFEFEHVEKLVVVNALSTAGTPDRVGRYTGPGPVDGMWFENELLITDLKTGTTDYGRLKMASQLAVYSRGEFYDWSRFPVDVTDEKAFKAWKKAEVPAEEAAAAYTSIGDVNQEWGVIFNLPSGSGEVEMFWANLTIGWELAELALVIRKARSKKGALVPFQRTTSVG